MNAREWMRNNICAHLEPETGDPICTTLAEDCADTLYGRAAEEREFELAHEVACEFEAMRNRVPARPPQYADTSNKGWGNGT